MYRGRMGEFGPGAGHTDPMAGQSAAAAPPGSPSATTARAIVAAAARAIGARVRKVHPTAIRHCNGHLAVLHRDTRMCQLLSMTAWRSSFERGVVDTAKRPRFSRVPRPALLTAGMRSRDGAPGGARSVPVVSTDTAEVQWADCMTCFPRT